VNNGGLEMIEELITQLESIPDLSWIWAIFLVGSGLGFGGILLYIFEREDQVKHGSHISLIGFGMVGICALIIIPYGLEMKELTNEIKSEHIRLVSEMACDDIRLEIVSVMERSNDKSLKPFDYQRANIAWEEGYYYAKCELPLRDEILKLQTPQFILEMAR
jgi:hypothetical protein